MSGFRPTRAVVDLEAVRRNVRALRPPSSELMAVVKADAYGHGAVPVAVAALDAGATWLGVALLEEGLELRQAGIEARILVLSELPPGSEKEALVGGITPTVYSEDSVRRLAQAAGALGGRAAVHVKVDTGMHRAGVHPPEEAAPFVEMARAAGLEVEAVWTHLARAEEDVDTTDRQLDRFDEVLEGLGSRGLRPPLVHAANTAGAILHPRSRLDLVRVGIGLYGLEPAPGLRERLGLLPALEWTSRVASVRRLAAAEPVSYGHRYRLEREAHVATVPVGYADGYPRALSSRADVLIRGARHRVAGTVTMDQILVDCGDEPVETGDEVVLIGAREREEVTAEELAALSGTINYEIVCGIGRRVPREHTA